MKAKRTVLVIDDSKDFIEDFKSLTHLSFVTLGVTNERDAFDALNNRKIDLVFLDLVLGPGVSGIDILVRIKNSFPDTPVIMMTAHAAVETAVEAMRLGAFHYISKSPKVEELAALMEKAIEQSSLRQQVDLLREQIDQTSGSIVGKSAAIKDVFESIQRVAITDISVLITGESGTGKELVSKEIHYASNRRDEPFIAVNCGAIVKDLIETELFGHVKGAFTGATQSKPGKFELADGGTIFLDEVAELDSHSQVKLLRVLQEREIDRVGGTSSIPVNVRVIAATNKDLSALTQDGQFREDLFYRLNVFPIHVPPLRQRKEDIPMLVDAFLERFGRSLGKPNLRLAPSTMDQLQQYDWPGNVRELENAIQRCILLSTDGIIRPDFLPREFSESSFTSSIPGNLPQVEKEAKDFAARRAILKALEKTNWSVEESAKLLGIPTKTLYDKCARLQIKLARRDTGNTT